MTGLEDDSAGDLDLDSEPRLSTLARVRRELVTHKTAYIVLVLFMFGGIFIIPWIFPEATPGMGALGGLFLGVWASLSAVPNKFFDE
jgi:hypothetical protein